jgi:toxin FitB
MAPSINANHIFVSAATVGEIQRGIEITREQDIEKATQLELWLSNLIAGFSIVPIEATHFQT